MKKFFVFATVALIVAYWVTGTAAPGVEFTLDNVGPDPLGTVTVEVTGRSYSLGDIPPGGSQTIRLEPTGESHIVLQFSTGRRLTLDCYLEPDYRGKIVAKVTSRKVVLVKDEARPSSIF